MGVVFLVAFLLALLIGTIWGSYALWIGEGNEAISGHILVAMIVGVVFSLAVGIGLMFLVFYSARKGYDNPAERERK